MGLGFRPLASFIYRKIIPLDDLLSALTHPRPQYLQQNKTLNTLALMGQPKPRHRYRSCFQHHMTWANSPERITAMFGRMMIEPIVPFDPTIDLPTAVATLIKVTENLEIVRCIELQAAATPNRYANARPPNLQICTRHLRRRVLASPGDAACDKAAEACCRLRQQRRSATFDPWSESHGHSTSL